MKIHFRFHAVTLGACLLSLVHAASAATWYVQAGANPVGANGSQTNPYLTVSTAMTHTAPGDTVIIGAGTYREHVDCNRAGSSGSPITYQAATDAQGNYVNVVMKGSDLFPAGSSAWTLDSGSIYKRTFAIRPQQVFVNFNDLSPSPTSSLRQIGNPNPAIFAASGGADSPVVRYPNPLGGWSGDKSSMTAGTFYWDSTTTTLYVWLNGNADPNLQNMEVSQRRRIFFCQVQFINLKGIKFRHSNQSTFAAQDQAVGLNSNCNIEDCDVQWTDFTGIGLGNNAQVIDCNVSYNGALGIVSSGMTNTIVRGCNLSFNNQRGFNPQWHAGGFKGVTPYTAGTVEDCEVNGNLASGIWFDSATATGLKTIRRNYVHHNGPQEAGIFFELSKNGRIYNNVLVSNNRRGIFVRSSDDTQIYNNTISNQIGLSSLELFIDSATLTNNTIYNNIIANGTTTNADLYVQKNGGTGVSGNVCNYNDIWRSTGSIILKTNGGTWSSLTTWNTNTGYDGASKNVDPAFIVGSGSDFRIPTTSLLKEAGTNLVSGVLTTDYVNTARNGTYDIGAYEASASSAPTQTLYTTQVPSGSSGVGLELGTKFKSSVNGTIVGVRIYAAAAETTGTHQVRIWNSNGNLLVGPYDWTITGGAAGWKSFTLPSPASIVANVYYIVSVSGSPGTTKYARSAAGFNAPINSGNLRADVGAGLYTTSAGAMPNTTENNSSYYRDVIFQP